MAKYRFSGVGNGTIVLQKSYTDVIRNTSGDPITTKFVPSLKAVFNNGYFETDDKFIAELLTKYEFFGKRIYWHPTMAGSEPNFDKAKSAPIENSKQAMAKRKKKAREARLESGMRYEDS